MEQPTAPISFAADSTSPTAQEVEPFAAPHTRITKDNRLGDFWLSRFDGAQHMGPEIKYHFRHYAQCSE
jgi:hypothetical protein